MTDSEFFSILLKHIPYSPTAGQKQLLGKLAQFILGNSPNEIFLLKGYAGTGKTTVISTVVNQLYQVNRKSVLLAPTGRAAKVLKSYSGKNAYTIHKKIYIVGTRPDGSVQMVLNRNKHAQTIFFVDEASMIQTGDVIGDSLFVNRNILEDLVSYVQSGKNCKLVLIGDTAQLPPVGMNISPALDMAYLKASFNISIFSFELTEVVRQAMASGILFNATEIRTRIEEKGLEQFIHTQAFKDILSITGETLEDHLNTAFSGGDVFNSTLITRSNKRANIYNQEIRKRILFRENEIATGDLLMVVRNNYFWLPENSEAGFIANGDIAEIRRIGKYEELYGFRFADVTLRLADYPDEPDLEVKIILNSLMIDGPSLNRQQMTQLFEEVMKDYEEIPQRRKRLEQVKKNPWFNALQVKFAYALTCHKTQGGQWENVFIDLGYLKEEHMNSSFNRWLYTAFTRATRKLFLVNFPERFFT
ncbi:MAG: AAA family ATPase [Bacteroidetes bacterium]|nr:AAA family ATPase [Bacteroidota bacterium]